MRRVRRWGPAVFGVAVVAGCGLNPRPEDPGARGGVSPTGSPDMTSADGASPMDPAFPPPPGVSPSADGGVRIHDGADATSVSVPPQGPDAASDAAVPDALAVPDAEASDSPVGP